MTSQHTPARILYLDALRGIAALLVFFSHAGALAWPVLHEWMSTWFNIGEGGVFLFFLISGAIIPVSLEQHGSLRIFWLRRLCRLWPLLVAVLLAWWLLIDAGARPTSTFQRLLWIAPEASVHRVLANVTLFPQLFNSPSSFGTLWTLQVEEIFYLTVALLYMAGLLRWSVVLAGMWCLLALLSRDTLLLYLAVLYTGTVFARYREGRVSLPTLLAVVLLAGSAITVVSPTTSLLVGRLGALPLFLTIALWNPAFVPSALQWLGQVSYSVYLIHMLVLGLLPPVGPPAVALVVWLGCVLALAAGTYYAIEQPWIRLGRRVTTTGGQWRFSRQRAHLRPVQPVAHAVSLPTGPAAQASGQ